MKVSSQRDAPTEILGADPGSSGALALYNPATQAIEVFDMPTKRAARGKTAKDVDGYALGILIDGLKHRVIKAVVEQVSSRPRQGGQFTFGISYGRLLGALEANLIPVTHVPSSKWKPAMGLRGEGKGTSVALAVELFPALAAQLRRAKDDGRAEAALIAYYGAKLA